MTTTPLLETKLYVPRPRRRLVPRPRLTERLNRGAESTLTLLSAPAGFGKTTLLAEWLADTSSEPSVAWLSLDEADNQPARFWSYVIAALQTVAPQVGTGALPLLQSSPPPPIETVLATLLNELSAIRTSVVLVELRAPELRFLPEEAAAYLNEVMGLGLAAPEVAALAGRTEGWVAALQLAALSLQGRDDMAGFIAGFAGDDRYIVDYLVEEVLQRQPAAVRRFLLHTSILERLSAPLCEAVTGNDGGQAMLAALDRGNLFVVALDDRRRWYRYHHLFADVLRAHLQDEQPDQLPELHRRASAWYERAGDPSEAIRHA